MASLAAGCGGRNEPASATSHDASHHRSETNETNGEEPALPHGVTPEIYETARQQFQSAYGRAADQDDVLSWLAEAAAGQGQYRIAVACFETISSTHPRYGHAARYQQGHCLIKLRQVSDAERNFREFLRVEQQSPQMQPAHQASALWQLAHIYAVELRLERRQEVLEQLHELGAADIRDTLGYCYPTLHRWNGTDAVQWAEEYWQEDPDDFYLRLAVGRYRTLRGRIAEAREMLETCRAEQPGNLQAAAGLWECLLEAADQQAVQQLVSQLPEARDDEPWLLLRLRGHYYNRLGRYHQAIECFQWAIAADPAGVDAHLGLARAYGGLQKSEQQREALQVAHGLARIQNRIGWVLESQDNAEPLKEIIEISLDIGLKPQAELVLKQASKRYPDYEPFKQLLARNVSAED